MFPQWIIEKKRDGAELTAAEIDFFLGGYVAGRIPDYQMAALAMAIAIRGMTMAETCSLTKGMIASGIVLDTSSIRLPKIDKHSTGGVGDKISLVLAPLVAACGGAVPMIAGRGLGLTAGQAGGDSGLSHRSRGRRIPAGRRRMRVRDCRRVRAHRAGRQKTLRPARCHRHRAFHPVDCRQHSQQESGRRARWAGI